MYYLRQRNNLLKFIKVNYLFFIICLSFLLYQSIDLFILFMSGKTVINISVGIIRNTSLPAITLGIAGLDFSRVSLSNENVSIVYKEYLYNLALLENANKSRIDDLQKYLTKLYLTAANIYYQSKEQNIQTEHILNSLIPSDNAINGTRLNCIFFSASAYGDIDKDLYKYSSHSLAMKSFPMESLFLIIEKKFLRIIKYYTLFSHSESSWDNIKMVFNTINIYLEGDTNSLPFFPINYVHMIMHSPKTLLFEGYSDINIGYRYLIEYSKWNVIRLGKGYDTDCREYNSKEYTRNDCIFYCYQESANLFVEQIIL